MSCCGDLQNQMDEMVMNWLGELGGTLKMMNAGKVGRLAAGRLIENNHVLACGGGHVGEGEEGCGEVCLGIRSWIFGKFHQFLDKNKLVELVDEENVSMVMEN